MQRLRQSNFSSHSTLSSYGLFAPLAPWQIVLSFHDLSSRPSGVSRRLELHNLPPSLRRSWVTTTKIQLQSHNYSIESGSNASPVFRVTLLRINCANEVLFFSYVQSLAIVLIFLLTCTHLYFCPPPPRHAVFFDTPDAPVFIKQPVLCDHARWVFSCL